MFDDNCHLSDAKMPLVWADCIFNVLGWAESPACVIHESKYAGCDLVSKERWMRCGQAFPVHL